MDLPPGTRKHFNNPGETENSGAALDLLSQFGDIDSSFNFEGGDFKFPTFDDDSFKHEDTAIPHVQGDGIVPHGGHVEVGHNEVQYGVSSHNSAPHEFSTGFSDFGIGGFGPVKHDSVISDGHDSGHHGGEVSYSVPHFGGGGLDGSVHHGGGGGGGFGHVSSSFKPVISHGSIPYGAPPSPSYGPPPKPVYGPPPKPIVNHAVVIPIHEGYGRPHRGRGKGGKGYFKKFMGMFGY